MYSLTQFFIKYFKNLQLSAVCFGFFNANKIPSFTAMQYTECFIMYFEITKIYYRKTIGHIFTKPVQIEGTIEKFFPQYVVFHHSSHFCR
jgi:hypothetical protein